MAFIVGVHLHFAAYITVVVALGQGNTAGVSSHFNKALYLINSNLECLMKYTLDIWNFVVYRV